MINKELADKINKELVIPDFETETLNKDFIKQVKKWIEEDKQIYFYHNSKWLKLRQEILRTYHNECVLCKLLNGKITTHDNRLKNGEYRGLQIHHMKEIELYPEYCLSPTVIDIMTGKKVANLIPLCQLHHNMIHNKENNIKAKNKFMNKERW